MWYDSKIVAHSISDLGNDIVTFEITVPKWLVAEINTHKCEVERNSASSRAVPTKLIISMVDEHPCLPLWRYNQSGMIAAESLNKEDEDYANKIWLETRDLVVKQVEKLQSLPSGRSVAKGTANRPLEFVMWTKVVITFTGGGGIGINNFFGLRDSEFAQPEFGYVAKMMHEQYHDSEPVKRRWHLPYITETCTQIGDEILSDFGDASNDDEWNEIQKKMAVVSSARCGRVTHYKQGEVRSLEEDMKRGESFAEQGHYSPLRHAARAGGNEWYGNMYGWKPISKIIMPKGRDYVAACCDRARVINVL
jgi:hypothetical protein